MSSARVSAAASRSPRGRRTLTEAGLASAPSAARRFTKSGAPATTPSTSSAKLTATTTTPRPIKAGTRTRITDHDPRPAAGVAAARERRAGAEPGYCAIHQSYKWCEHNGGIGDGRG